MLKTHVIHMTLDGSAPAQEKINGFQNLVDQFRVDAKHDVRKTEFFVTPVFGRVAVQFTAIMTYTDAAATLSSIGATGLHPAISGMGDLNTPKVA